MNFSPGPSLSHVKISDTSVGSSDGDPVQFSKLFDVVDFVSQSEVWVSKNILAWAQNPTDNAGLIGFDQRLSRQAVPEPASLGLMTLGLTAPGATRRRRG